FRKKEAAGSDERKPEIRPRAVIRKGRLAPVPMPTVPRPAAPPPKRMVSPPAVPDPAETSVDAVWAAADAGRYAEASEMCEARIKSQGVTVETLYLLGLVRDAGGEFEHAADCYRKVLFLDPKHSEALMHLALLDEQAGHAERAKRLRDRARRAAAGR